MLLLINIRVALHAGTGGQAGSRPISGTSTASPPSRTRRKAGKVCVCIACYLYHRCMYTYLKLERDMEMISSILVIHIFFSENWFLFVLFIFPKENKNSNAMIEQ